ncbi:hypothetical protein [Vibrio parahaemolyticus]|uniref:hypothetical protein n=1 Tax=Vibrio parahaemolyticus TaxID=670 RepID=UPI0011231B4D|nr:hypothetical protein [Vibrio parahaemolyticus]TOG88576.1 hypothetical protein CGI92_23050 [Vibrio parahaemolyticus]
MSLLEFFKGCRRPLYYKSKVNKLNVHVLLSLGGIRQCVAKHRFVYGQAYIVRDPKGWYRFVGLWTLPTKSSRADVWVEGRFKLHKGQMKFEESVTAGHLAAFFKVCRYLGVHKRVEATRYQQASQRYHENAHQRGEDWEFEYGFRDLTAEYQMKREQGSWFLAEGLPPLFCGLTLDGLNVKENYRRSHIKQDVRDRMVVSPLVAMVYKQEIRERNG